MAEVVGRSSLLAPPGSSVRLPVAHMVCNQSPPLGDQPSLMTFREVETLFHEFGHALQHMLTDVDEGLVAGIRGVEWDAVELPSQFMENWCYDRPTLYSFAKHYETGEPLPEEFYQRLKAAKTFRAGAGDAVVRHSTLPLMKCCPFVLDLPLSPASPLPISCLCVFLLPSDLRLLFSLPSPVAPLPSRLFDL